MRSLFLFACYGFLILPSFGAGPLLTPSYKPKVWSTGLVRYTFDPGSLGILTPYQARQLVKDAFQAWEDVDTATIRFQQDGTFDSDVTDNNGYSIFNSAQRDKLNPIIFDDDGAILELLMGQGASESILGLTQVTASANGVISYAWSIYNGRFLSQGGFDADSFLSTVIHELGHFIGLDHSQLFRHLALNRYGGDDKYVPILFPVSTDDEAERTSLTKDDRNSISMMYPVSSFSSQYGEIQGKVMLEGDKSFPGVNVVARKTDDPLATATTCVSDYLHNGSGSYRLAGLPPGKYLLWVEPIDPRFYGASQVGPYTETASGLSFTRPPKAEFYNGQQETYNEADDNRSEAVTVSVEAGEITKNIDFRANSNPNPQDEQTIQILASGYPETGAVWGRKGYLVMDSYQYLFIFSEEAEFIRIEVDADATAKIQVYIRHESRVEFDYYDAMEEGSGHFELLYSRDSNPPLQPGRYFIGIVNTLAPTTSYTLTAHAGQFLEGDLNGDGQSDKLDLYYFSTHWKEIAGDANIRTDVVKDDRQQIDEADLRRLIELLRTR
ncbi:MAG: matrixin family metalloprotease [bacterium]